MSEAFLPLIKQAKGRIVNVSSVGSLLRGYSDETADRLRNTKTVEDVEALAKAYEVRMEAAGEVQHHPSRVTDLSFICVTSRRVLYRVTLKKKPGSLRNLTPSVKHLSTLTLPFLPKRTQTS